MPSRDASTAIQVAIFVIGLVLSFILNRDDIIYGVILFIAFSIVTGFFISVCRDISKKHRIIVLVFWCMLILFTGPIGYILHEIFYAILDRFLEKKLVLKLNILVLKICKYKITVYGKYIC